MTLKYFVKCISFQNQFWSIIFYAVALVASLSLIYIDGPIYTQLFIDKSDPYTRNNTSILTNVNSVNLGFFLGIFPL